MKKACILLLAMGVTWVATAQKVFPAKHLIGINYSNDITSRFADGDLGLYNSPVRYGFAAAVLYQYMPRKWFSAETGLELNSTTYYLDNPNSNIMTAWDGEIFNPVLPNSLDFGWRTQRLAIPMNFRWHYTKGQWSVYALTGILFNMDFSKKHLYEIPGWNSTSNLLDGQDFNENFNIGISTGVGAEYTFYKHWVLRLEPRFRTYNLYKPVWNVSYVDDSPIRERDWALGLNVGVYYNLNKN